MKDAANSKAPQTGRCEPQAQGNDGSVVGVGAADQPLQQIVAEGKTDCGLVAAIQGQAGKRPKDGRHDIALRELDVPKNSLTLDGSTQPFKS